jgi:hypothetical protein
VGGQAKDARSFSFQLRGDDLRRFWWLQNRALERNHLAARQNLLEELLGLVDHGLTTKEERAFFRGKVKAPPPPQKGEDFEDINIDALDFNLNDPVSEARARRNSHKPAAAAVTAARVARKRK